MRGDKDACVVRVVYDCSVWVRLNVIRIKSNTTARKAMFYRFSCLKKSGGGGEEGGREGEGGEGELVSPLVSD